MAGWTRELTLSSFMVLIMSSSGGMHGGQLLERISANVTCIIVARIIVSISLGHLQQSTSTPTCSRDLQVEMHLIQLSCLYPVVLSNLKPGYKTFTLPLGSWEWRNGQVNRNYDLNEDYI